VERLGATPSQTVGPFFSFSLLATPQSQLVPAGTRDALRIEGRVLDGEGAPVSDAMVELWQAARSGRYAHPADTRADLTLDRGFTGFGRCGTDDEGRFSFVTVKPGRVPGPGGRMQAPHIEISVFARGLLHRLVTRLYFPDEEQANSVDPILASIEDPVARASLIAQPGDQALRFDIRLQGERETTFFAI
jgi:protocatechuate 3,4-dioxygenase alpha subunit